MGGIVVSRQPGASQAPHFDLGWPLPRMHGTWRTDAKLNMADSFAGAIA